MARFDRAANQHRLGDIAARNQAVKEARGIGMSVPGLRELRRDFRNISRTLDKEIAKELKAAAEPIRREAVALAPRRRGKLQQSIKTSVTQRGISIRSNLPYANVIHWGGSVGKGHQPNNPWSGRTLIRPSLFISRAIERHEEQVMDAFGEAIENAFLRASGGTET